MSSEKEDEKKKKKTVEVETNILSWNVGNQISSGPVTFLKKTATSATALRKPENCHKYISSFL
jgi:hypothetical protein